MNWSNQRSNFNAASDFVVDDVDAVIIGFAVDDDDNAGVVIVDDNDEIYLLEVSCGILVVSLVFWYLNVVNFVFVVEVDFCVVVVFVVVFVGIVMRWVCLLNPNREFVAIDFGW